MVTYKDNVRVATTGNITLSGAQTIDGVAVAAGNRVLVKNQTTASANGIYTVGTGGWSRATDANTSVLMSAETTVRVSEGTVNAHTEWSLSTQRPLTLDTTALTFVRQLPVAVNTIETLKTLSGPFTNGHLFFALGHAATGDGGGGAFTYEETAPMSATISAVTTTAVAITHVTNATPIVITAASHGLQSGHVVKITGVGGNEAANGEWIVHRIDAATFSLFDTAGTAQYTSGGTVSYGMITTQAAHGLLRRDRIVIKGVVGATGVNGTWFPVGVQASLPLTPKQFTIPCSETGVYVSGGKIADGGISFFHANSKRFLRKDVRDVDVSWFGAVGDGMTDDSIAIQAALNAATKRKASLILPGKTYAVSREIRLAEQVGTKLIGQNFVLSANSGTRFKAIRYGMRAVLGIHIYRQTIENLFIDCDRKALYGIYIANGNASHIENVGCHKAIMDGVHVAGHADNTGTGARNDFLVIRDYHGHQNGSAYHTSGLNAIFGSGLPGNHYANTVMAGTVSITKNTNTITGVGTSFLSLRTRINTPTTGGAPFPKGQGDLIRVGTSPFEVLEIDSIDSDTQIITRPESKPYATYSGVDWAISIGDGYHEEVWPDNNRASCVGGQMLENAGSGWVFRGAYGPNLDGSNIIGQGFFGVVVGSLDGGAGIMNTRLAGVYFEGNGGAAGSIFAGTGYGMTVDNPRANGHPGGMTVATLGQNVHTWVDQYGATQWGGQQHAKNVTQFEWSRTKHDLFATPVSAYSTAYIDCSSVIPAGGRPTVGASVRVIDDNHTGKIDINVNATYRTSAAAADYQGGSLVLSVRYKMVGGVFSLVGAVENLTPASQIDANLLLPTFDKVTGFNNVKYLRVKFFKSSHAYHGGLCYWSGLMTVIRTGIN